MLRVFPRRLAGLVFGWLTVDLLFFTAVAQAEAVAVTAAMSATAVVEVFVEEKEIRVELEASVPDLRAFEGIFPDEFRVRMGLKSEPEGDRLERFFGDEFVIRANGGAPLRGRLISFETGRRVPRDEITGQPLPVVEPSGKQVVFVVFGYQLKERPNTLTFRPPTDADGGPAATIGLIVHHQGLPVMDYCFLVGEETLDLDWNDPWFSTFRNRDLRRRYDSPLNLFLYVEPFEVRVEIVARPADVQAWTDLGLGGLTSIPVEIQDEVKRRAGEFFVDNLHLTIDGEPVVPILDRIDYLNRTARASSDMTEPRELNAKTATLGAILFQPRMGYPREAEVDWELFPDRVEGIAAAATDRTGSNRLLLVREDHVLRWKSSLEDPDRPPLMDVRTPPSALARIAMWLCSLGLAVAAVLLIRAAARAAGGSASWTVAGVLALLVSALAAGGWVAARSVNVDADRASEIVAALLHNVYRAFDFRDEEMIYRTLRHSVTDDVLTEAYVETRRGLELAGREGARAKVAGIELADLAMIDSDDGFTVRCKWNVTAAVGHWGYLHSTVIRYAADLHLEPVDGVWKIAAIELIEERQR